MTEIERPYLPPPFGEAAEDLVICDVTIGEGVLAGPGQRVSCHYVGVAHSTGREFDASWDRGAPLEFILGQGQVLDGLDRGVVGMRVGGRRRLTVPAHLGYGNDGVRNDIDLSEPPTIRPGETLSFIVDLLDAH